MLRRISYRSALTASLATRLVPVLARDASRMSDAARCRPQPPGRGSRWRAPRWRARSTGRWTSRLRSRCAATRSAGGPRARCAAVVAPRLARGGGGRADRRRWRWRARSPASGTVEPYPTLEVETARPSSRSRARWCCVGAAAVRRAARRDWGWRVAEPLVVRRAASATAIPRRARRVAARRLARDRARARSRCSPGVSGSGKSTLLRALCGLVPHFHGGEACGELTRRRPRRARARAGRARGGVRHRLPGARDAGGDGRRARRARAAARAPRRAAPASVARAVEETALALGVGALLDRRTDTLSGGELQRVAIAAAMVHGPALLRARRADLAARPGRRRRARLAAAAPERGLGDGRAGGRAPARALPARGRPRDRDGRRAVACDAAPARVPRLGGRATPRRSRRPAAWLFSLAGLRPLPASVKEARAALRASRRCVPVAMRRKHDTAPRSRRAAARRSRAAAARCARVRALVRARGRAGDAARHRAASWSPASGSR